ncbi:MAG TPA: protein-disulfide reductase DsbD [Burkholderiaceae bacterium]|nr:protein-disulfide reductase DsbD [Burkholderiaceae bacterium]
MIRRLLLWFALAALPLHAAAAQDLLEPEQAFRFSARALGSDAIEVHFAIADGYYLYRERFKFAAQNARLGNVEFPTGERKKDEFFGETEIYRKEVRIRLTVAPGAGDPLQLAVTSQGCADVGVCYVPMESQATLRLASLAANAAPPRAGLAASDVDVAAMFRGNAWVVLASFLGFGLLLAFTPCVLPMIPILSSIIAGEGANVTKTRALALSSSYVLGMAVAYALAGIAAAYSGSLIAASLQNAWVIGAFALVFVLLSLSMFGVYELQLPGFLRHPLAAAHRRLAGGKLASVAGMGVLSAVIMSPCVAAPLAGALLYISQTRDVALGGTALFAMALGMGIPLLVIGVSGGALLPRAGRWMNAVKKFFGVLLLAMAVWIAWPLVLDGKGATKFERVASVAELEAKLTAPGKPVMLDFYADWCVSCKEMEAFTFSDARVKAKFEHMLLLQADVTANTAEHKALLKRFSLFGPPGIVFFDARGRELQGLRVIGYQDAERFLKTLERAEAD